MCVFWKNLATLLLVFRESLSDSRLGLRRRRRRRRRGREGASSLHFPIVACFRCMRGVHASFPHLESKMGAGIDNLYINSSKKTLKARRVLMQLCFKSFSNLFYLAYLSESTLAHKRIKLADAASKRGEEEDGCHTMEIDRMGRGRKLRRGYSKSAPPPPLFPNNFFFYRGVT